MQVRAIVITSLTILLVFSTWVISSHAGIRKNRGQTDAGSETASESTSSPEEDDRYLGDLAIGDICFVKKGELWLRLTPGQYRTAKARSRVKRRGLVRTTLRPRQIRALNMALGTDRQVPKVIISVRAVELRRMRMPRERVESHFVIQEAEEFKRRFRSGELDEK